MPVVEPGNMRGGELVNRTVPFLNSFLFRWSKEIVHEISKMKKKETQGNSADA